jgi:hypothetical protein
MYKCYIPQSEPFRIYSRRIFGRWSIRVSAGTPTEVFVNFLSPSRQVLVQCTATTTARPLPPESFPIHHSFNRPTHVTSGLTASEDNHWILNWDVHATTLSVVRLCGVELREDGSVVNWMEFRRKRQLTELRHYPGIHLEGPRKITENFSQDTLLPDLLRIRQRIFVLNKV